MKIPKKIKTLLKLVEKFLELKMNAIEFEKKYEKLYSELLFKNSFEEINNNFNDFLADVHAEINYFEPNEEYRKEHSSYLDEKQLRKRVTKLYKKLRSSLK